jgi:phospholipid/cholesterol/gamma-HCH transport system substrate-binding protein
MEPKVSYTFVGIITLLLVGALAATLVYVARRGASGSARTFTVYFRNQSLSGLQQDSYVTMRGIKVGKVHSLSIADGDTQRVRVELSVDKGVPVKTDTKAVVQRSLLTGLAAIELQGGTQTAENLRKCPEGERYPIIEEGKTSLEVIQNTLPEALTRANLLLEQGTLFFSEENRALAHRTLVNLESLSQRLAATSGRIDQAFSRFDTLLVSLEHSSATLTSETAATLEALRKAAQSVVLSVSELARAGTLTAERLSSTAEQYDNPRSLIFGPSTEALGPGERGR